jgi:hypothetical protein
MSPLPFPQPQNCDGEHRTGSQGSNPDAILDIEIPLCSHSATWSFHDETHFSAYPEESDLHNSALPKEKNICSKRSTELRRTDRESTEEEVERDEIETEEKRKSGKKGAIEKREEEDQEKEEGETEKSEKKHREKVEREKEESEIEERSKKRKNDELAKQVEKSENRQEKIEIEHKNREGHVSERNVCDRVERGKTERGNESQQRCWTFEETEIDNRDKDIKSGTENPQEIETETETETDTDRLITRIQRESEETERGEILRERTQIEPKNEDREGEWNKAERTRKTPWQRSRNEYLGDEQEFIFDESYKGNLRAKVHDGDVYPRVNTDDKELEINVTMTHLKIGRAQNGIDTPALSGDISFEEIFANETEAIQDYADFKCDDDTRGYNVQQSRAHLPHPDSTSNCFITNASVNFHIQLLCSNPSSLLNATMPNYLA